MASGSSSAATTATAAAPDKGSIKASADSKVDKLFSEKIFIKLPNINLAAVEKQIYEQQERMATQMLSSSEATKGTGYLSVRELPLRAKLRYCRLDIAHRSFNFGNMKTGQSIPFRVKVDNIFTLYPL
jgi:hypothetical protein